MSETIIKPREKKAIVGSLKVGIVPKIGIQHIQVGRSREIAEMLKDFESISSGGATTRFIIGDYGCGKTFFLTLAKLVAHESNLVVAFADISISKVLSSSDGKARALFSELINNLSTKTKPDGGALQSIIEKWATSVIKSGLEINIENIHKSLLPLEKYVNSYDFSKVITEYLLAYDRGDDIQMSNALRWLRAEYTTKTEARNDLGVRTIINDSEIYDYLKLYAGFVTLAGYNGLVVNIDELAVLQRLQSQIRNKNYEVLLSIINDSTQGSTEHIGFIFSGTPAFLEDKYKGMNSYEALETRLADNPNSKKGMEDLSGPVIRLSNLSPEELYVLFFNIRNVFALGDKSKYLVTDLEIQQYLQSLLNKLGTQAYLSPRESNKAFVGLLTQLENYPNSSISDFIDTQTIIPDKNEEDELFEFKL
ncbi:MAG: ATP-binding protein [Candidatus Pacebacteria bacterium]|uniref:ATP-binding protein n=1 Tax=Methanocorpusculum sp. GPch4 TaxID=2527877 RepID=UPI0014331A31|nr:ATP-binding protein [Methanocorpusculum sp. GPch4]MDD3970201.1 ATP-binding protein [Candidatus Paceibacterota bacterium]